MLCYLYGALHIVVMLTLMVRLAAANGIDKKVMMNKIDKERILMRNKLINFFISNKE